MKNAIRLAGSGGNRKRDDFYQTPNYVTDLLLKYEEFSSVIWEPACGTGDISKILSSRGLQIYSSDLNADYYGFGEKLDFLSIKNNQKFKSIITNPPFSLATEFILKSKSIAQEKIAMFLRTSFLEGIDRYKLFQDKKFPLKCIYQFSRRVSFGQYAKTNNNGGMIPFAWFVWDKNWSGEPVIRWFNPSEQKSGELLRQEDMFASKNGKTEAIKTMDLF